MMNLKKLLIFGFFLNTTAFFIPPVKPELLNNIEPIKQFSDNNINKNYKFFSDIYDSIIPQEKRIEIGEKIVRESTALLPRADSIGHIVLHTNEKIINYLLDNCSFLDMEQKKQIILFLINTARNGDDMGSLILSVYHDIINHVL